MKLIGQRNIATNGRSMKFIQEHMEEFLQVVTDYACRIAKRRGAARLHVADISLVLSSLWDIHLPGYTIPSPFPQLGGHAEHERRQTAVSTTRQRVGEE